MAWPEGLPGGEESPRSDPRGIRLSPGAPTQRVHGTEHPSTGGCQHGTRSTAQAPRPVLRSGQGRRQRPPSMARAEATHSPRLAATTDKKYPQGCCCRHVAEHGPSRICAEPPRLRTPRVKVRSAQGLPCLHPTRARRWPCSSVITAEITVPAMPAPPLWDQDPRGPMDRASPCSPPWVWDPTGAGLAGEWELLDGWGGGVAVVVGLVHPPVRSLPK